MLTWDGRADADPVAPRLLVGGDLDTHVGALRGYSHGEDPSVDDDDPASTARLQLDDLLGQGVTHVLDVRVEWGDEAFLARHAPTVNVLHLGIDDDGQRVADEWFSEGTAWVLDALEDPAATVLVHCHAGINRGPSMGFAVLLRQGVPPVEALEQIRAGRPQAQVAYALDALRWHHDRTDAPKTQRDRERLALQLRLTPPDEVERLEKE